MRRYPPKIIFFIKVVFSILCGTIIYAFWRGIHIFGINPLLASSPPDWIIYNLPDGLWFYALLSALIYIWKGQPSGKLIFWLFISTVLAFLTEIFQALKFIPGTFDKNDVIAYCVSGTLAILQVQNKISRSFLTLIINKMKTSKNLYSALTLIVFALLFIASAVQKDFYQVYKTVPENGKMLDKSITFEDENCVVSYDLWSEGGDIGFTMYNKTEFDIIVNLDKSFFISNGVAFDYYKNRIITKTSNVGSIVTTHNTNPYWYHNTSVSGTSSSSYSTAYVESPTLIIPSKTSKSIYEYHVVSQYYSSCDLLKYPSKKEIKILTFDTNNSPFIFYNLISYKCNGANNKMENKFYVREIMNLSENQMLISTNPTDCGKTNMLKTIKVFKETAPNQFYFEYFKGNDTDKY